MEVAYVDGTASLRRERISRWQGTQINLNGPNLNFWAMKWSFYGPWPHRLWPREHCGLALKKCCGHCGSQGSKVYYTLSPEGAGAKKSGPWRQSFHLHSSSLMLVSLTSQLYMRWEAWETENPRLWGIIKVKNSILAEECTLYTSSGPDMYIIQCTFTSTVLVSSCQWGFIDIGTFS